jgi:hypothetical protein
VPRRASAGQMSTTEKAAAKSTWNKVELFISLLPRRDAGLR